MRILILLLFTITAFGQHRQRLNSTDIERFGLEGKIKSYSHIDYQPFLEKDSLNDLKIDDFILAPNNYKIEFNNIGYIKRKIELDYLRDEDTLIEKGIWVYEYDKINRIKEENYYWNNRSIDTTQWIYKYPNDSTTIIHQYDKTYKHLRYQYQQSDNLEYFTKANSDSSYVTKGLFVYDKYNRITRIEEYENKNYIQNLRSQNYKDTISKNPSIKVWIFTKYNAPPTISTHEYDSFGNEIKSSGVGKGSRTHLTEYKYDQYNNWTEKKVNLSNGRIKITRRKFEYWE
ncbi:hypothetical protein [Lacinutrix undariae]